MKSGRDKKIAEEIRREVSQILHFELSDPRVLDITVTGVTLSPDLQLARIYFAAPGAEQRKISMQTGLKKASGYVRRRLAEKIRMKFLPQIEFFYDESFELEKKIRALFPDATTPPTPSTEETL